MVKPLHTLRFLALVLVSLACLMFFFPEKGIKLSDDMSLHFPSLSDWWIEATTRDTSSLSAAFIPDLVEEDLDDKPNSFEDNNGLSDSSAILMADVPTTDSSVYSFKPHKIDVDNIRQPLELPASGLDCLKNLFDCLVNPDELSRVVRILHYGDSQIEADRISNYMRYKLQQQFGGSGPGLVPAKTAYDYKSPCQVVNDGQWKRFTIFPKIDTTIRHSKYGVLASFSRFSPVRVEEPAPQPEANDSLLNIDSIIVMPKIMPDAPDVIYNASLKFIPSTFGHSNVGTIKRVKMFYGNNSKPFSVTVKDGETVLYADSIPASQYGSKTWNFPATPAEFKMDFSGADSPEIYAFAMDGLSGVAVDNIPLRGCSGTIFTKMNGAFLSQMYRDLNVKCIILQFGGNTVPSLKPGAVGGFKKSFTAQINYLRRIYPNVSIIVIGPADMSTKVEDSFETYEVLPELVQAMRNAALDNNCAFWDMYSAMGGKNTMPEWVAHEPPYAEKDYVHFTPNGANVIARMFYNSLISRYNQYLGN